MLPMNITKITNLFEDTAQAAKNSINRNFNTNCNVKIDEVKKETKNLFQKAYSWIGKTCGLNQNEKKS